MNLPTTFFVLVLLAVETAGTVPPPAGPAPTGTASVAQLTARLDALYETRDEPGSGLQSQALLDMGLHRAPADYGLLWRAARQAFWMSDDSALQTDRRSAIGKTGWDVAERAIAANPNDVAGYYWAALNIGNYALGLGVIKALSMGLDGKFTARLKRAQELDPAYQHGGIDVAWGRYYQKLPWPKRDKNKAADHYGQCLVAHPENLRGRVYLAELYEEDGKQADAKRLLDEVLKAPVGRYDAPEERRAKGLADRRLSEIAKRAP